MLPLEHASPSSRLALLLLLLLLTSSFLAARLPPLSRLVFNKSTQVHRAIEKADAQRAAHAASGGKPPPGHSSVSSVQSPVYVIVSLFSSLFAIN
jgi:hypothetical protein